MFDRVRVRVRVRAAERERGTENNHREKEREEASGSASRETEAEREGTPRRGALRLLIAPPRELKRGAAVARHVGEQEADTLLDELVRDRVEDVPAGAAASPQPPH